MNEKSCYICGNLLQNPKKDVCEECAVKLAKLKQFKMLGNAYKALKRRGLSHMWGKVKK